MKIYGIKLGDSWYRSHGGKSGNGCLQTEAAKFPSTFFDSIQQASEKIDELVRDFPEYGIDAAIIEISFSMQEVFVDPPAVKG